MDARASCLNGRDGEVLSGGMCEPATLAMQELQVGEGVVNGKWSTRISERKAAAPDSLRWFK